MLKKSRMSRVLQWTLLGSLCIAPVVAQTEAQPEIGGTAIIGLAAEPKGFNSALTSSTPDTVAGCMVYEGLLTIDTEDGKDEISPLLAESWEVSDDGLTYTFHLRTANWHDGQPFTSEDVRYTLEEVAAKFSPMFSAQVGANLLKVETPDEHTAIIQLERPYPTLLRTLNCTYSAPILPAHIFKDTDVATNPATTSEPIGTGPFKFESWQRGSHINLVRNEDYWEEGKPYLDGLIIRALPNAASRIQALMAGEIDFIPMVHFPLNDARMVESNPSLQIVRSGFAPGMTYAAFNLKRPPLDDARVRNALLMATDRQFIHDTAFSGFGDLGRAPWPSGIEWAANPDVNYDVSNPYDPELAAALLDEAGVVAGADGTRFSVNIIYDSAIAERNQVANALKANWVSIGVNANLQPLEIAVVMPRVFQEHDFDVYLHDNNSYGDPAIGVSRIFVTESIGRISGNAAQYSNPEVDALFAAGAKEIDPAKRAEIYQSIQPILVRDMPEMMLHELSGFDGASRRLHGLWGWIGNGRWAHAWLEQ
ncbi:peptide/nickel transport system substrate-binding protein [Devosia sp. 2618]